MKYVLFCQNPYAFGILEPFMQVLRERKHKYIWYVTEPLKERFPFSEEKYTTKIEDLENYRSDAILCPGNEVPHFLRGVKVQIFHGLAGEKKGHFRIRHYFDLYLTQGPFFTRKFNQLKEKHKDFEVIETGWPKLDVYGKNLKKYQKSKDSLLKEYKATHLVLYAPTFSPSLTSAPYLLEEVSALASNSEYLVLVKFHDLMDSEMVENYKKLASSQKNLIVEEEPNIIKFLLMADILVSDTSSVVYEFLLLDKPVITFKNNSKTILWDNSLNYAELEEKVNQNLQEDRFREQRLQIKNEYHPYEDGKSTERMVIAIEDYIAEIGVPERRKIPFLRRRKINRMFKR